ncbi:hypothetical protein [Stenotrophomonas sp.]|uniref:hypothetical protein n=1 Tax=Stenotrophomonas sp. TaxID=69392 RepID=UPI002FCAD7CC
MGYDIHITRRAQWFDEAGPSLTLQEWLDHIAQDPELQLETRPDADPGDAWWVPQPGTRMGLWHQQHRVVAKNPDPALLRKMYQIAQALDARVLGDENEEYGADGQPLAPDPAPPPADAMPALPSEGVAPAGVAAAADRRASDARSTRSGPPWRMLKIGLSIAVWLLCLPGLFLHGFFASIAPMLLVNRVLAREPTSASETLVMLALGASITAWAILAWMNIAWIRGYPVHWRWPLLGTVLAVAWQVPVGFGMSLVVIPGIALAIYLCAWHLWTGWRTQAKAPTRG